MKTITEFFPIIASVVGLAALAYLGVKSNAKGTIDLLKERISALEAAAVVQLAEMVALKAANVTLQEKNEVLQGLVTSAAAIADLTVNVSAQSAKMNADNGKVLEALARVEAVSVKTKDHVLITLPVVFPSYQGGISNVSVPTNPPAN